MSLFKKLNAINVSKHIEQKNGLNYLSWAWAWTTLCENAETVKMKVYENEAGWNYHSDGRTAWVKVGIEADGIEHIEMLPVLDFKNKSIFIDNITSFNVNTAIQRCATKAIARHGLGMYIYAGEDLPEVDRDLPAPSKAQQTDKTRVLKEFASICESYGVDTKEFVIGKLGEEVYNDKELLYKNVRHYMMKRENLDADLEAFSDMETPAYVE